MNQKNESVVVRLRPMGEMLKRKQREPVIAGRSRRDFAESVSDATERVRQDNAKVSRENARAGAWAFASGMAWASFVLIVIYQLTGGAA